MENFLLHSDIEEIVQRLGKSAHELEGKTILLAGGRGFLGRYYTAVFDLLNKVILKNPCKVIVLDNLITAGEFGATDLKQSNISFIQHDVSKPFEYKDHVDYIVQAAGIASPHYYRMYPLETLEVAISGTKHMLNLAKQKKARLVFFSSSEIYGDPDAKHVPTLESYRGNVACLGPRACYDESKRVGETLCWIYHNYHGIHTNIIRPFNVFGPGMQEKDYRVMPNFAHRIVAKQPLRVYGTGTQTRTFCYITDAMVGFLKVLIHGVPGEPYNIGNPKPEITMVELSKIFQDVLDHPVAIDLVEYPDSYPADEPMRRCPDITKANVQLSYSPQIALKEGVKRFMNWAKTVYTGEL